ncbi:HAD family hydrolase [uncultured Bacteroides sp.]|uniref:HAD family hydrolase n=1 Tax=uncultured Bacteroides sp. TaxID=162156 RepID=UPI00260CEEC3|nr:HAD-IA family hydrolase [uncultured Bacteroides sp.]
MKRYQTYLFDFDYTLADSSKGIVICFRNVLERHGHTGISDETIKRTIGKTLEESFTIMTGITDTETLAAYRKEYVKEADIHMTVNTFLFSETLEVLQRLKASGAKVGIISTKYRYRIMSLMNQKLPENFLDIVVGGEDVKTPKPSPEGLNFAISHLGTEKADTLYIGDSTVDAETAQAAGVDFAGVLHGVTTREELAPYPHICIGNDLNMLI